MKRVSEEDFGSVAVMKPGPTGSANVTREEFGATQVETRGETSTAAVQAREAAAIQSRYVMAAQFPRKMEEVRGRLLKECERAGFAGCARYSRPVGKEKDKETGKWVDKHAEGFSIRFAEAAIRCMRNIYPEAAVVFEDENQRIVRVTVTDLEANVPYSTEIVIRKTVERRFIKEDQEAISARTNSQGNKTYLVRASDDEVLVKQNALISKALRTLGLRLVPGDILDDCLDQIQRTLRGQSPEAARDKLIVAFDTIGVTMQNLQEFLGHSLAKVTPEEMDELRKVYTGIREQEVTWNEVMESRGPSGSVESALDAAAKRIAADLGYTYEQVRPHVEEKNLEEVLRTHYGEPQKGSAADKSQMTGGARGEPAKNEGAGEPGASDSETPKKFQFGRKKP